jgi:hypothetical protein
VNRIGSGIFIILVLSLSLTGRSYAANSIYTVSAAVLSKNSCVFQAPTTAAITFVIDPGSSSGTLQQSAQLFFICHGSSNPATFTFSHDYGVNASAPPNIMKSASGKSLNYTITLSPSSGTVAKNSPQTLTVTANIAQNDYKNAVADTYTDTVVVSLNP